MAYQLEICANSVASAIAAQKGGANRIELCDNLYEGGTTPSYGQIEWCVKNLDIEVWPLIRPRGGNFIYTKEEVDVILKDIRSCKRIGCTGIVTGILNQNNDIDIDACRKFMEHAYPLPIAFHRAFDLTKDLFKSLEEIIDLGFVRILTSGGHSDALSGKDKIALLVKQSDGRIAVMPGAGVNSANILEIATATGAKSFHTTAKEDITSLHFDQNNSISMGTSSTTTQLYQTSISEVKLLKVLLNKL